MLKFIAGFLLGVATTVTVVYWVAEEPSATQADLSDQSFAPDQMAEAKHALASSTDDKVTEATNTSTGADTVVEDSNLSASAQSASNVESATAKPQSTSAQQPGTGETSPARKSPANSTNDDYPPEIADMIENDVDKELQERYESDEREESWATYMKGQLTAYFAQKTALAQFYISLIDCRTSVCAVHALGYGPDALTHWNSATADLVSQPWFDFNSMSINRRNPQPDILGIVLILTK